MTEEPVSSRPELSDHDSLPDDAFAGLLRRVARAAPIHPDELTAEIARGNLVGRTIGHFRVLERLGAGGMGVVYGAEDRRLGRRVALKVLAPRALGEEGTEREGQTAPSGRYAIDLLLGEARAAARITHPNVAAIYAAGAADGLSYIAMEYVEGVTLRSRIALGPLPIADVLRYGRQIADGLAKAHERGVVHRDLKPDNVMIDRDDRIKILDFGLARPAPDAELDSGDLPPSSRRGATVAGTPTYMSPEQARGERVNARSDVFSFGVLVYEALTGTIPLVRGSGKGPASKLPAFRPVSELRPDAPAALCAIVHRCLEPDQATRFASGASLVLAIDEVGAGGSIPAQAPPPSLSPLLDIARDAVAWGWGLFARRPKRR